MTTEINDVIESMRDAVNAQYELQKAQDEYDGVSWDYHGQNIIKNLEDCNKNFENNLELYIEEKTNNKILILANIVRDMLEDYEGIDKDHLYITLTKEFFPKTFASSSKDSQNA